MSRVSARKKKREEASEKGVINLQDIELPDIPSLPPPLSLSSNGKSQPPPSAPKTPTVFPTHSSIREINNVDRVPLFSAECSPVDRECFIKVQSNRQRLHRLWRERARLYVIGFIGNLLSSRLVSNRWLQLTGDFLRSNGKLVFNSRQEM